MPVKKTLLNSRSFDIYQDRNKYYEVKVLYIIIRHYNLNIYYLDKYSLTNLDHQTKSECSQFFSMYINFKCNTFI